jgi:putative transposase
MDVECIRSRMRHRLYVHAVWTTKDRLPLIDARAATYLDEHLRIVARQERAHVLELGIVATHVHALIRLHPTTQIPRLLQRLKGSTSSNLRRLPVGVTRQTGWERGYNLQSVSERALEVVGAYVRDQPNHHPSDAIQGWASSFAAGVDSDAAGIKVA